MRFFTLSCAILSALLGLGCGDAGHASPPAPSLGAGGSPAWRAVQFEACAGGEQADPPLTDAELDRLLDALEQQIEKK